MVCRIPCSDSNLAYAERTAIHPWLLSSWSSSILHPFLPLVITFLTQLVSNAEDSISLALCAVLSETALPKADSRAFVVVVVVVKLRPRLLRLTDSLRNPFPRFVRCCRQLLAFPVAFVH